MQENKYDDARFFAQYEQMNRSRHGLEGAGEWHIMKTLLPAFDGKTVLDLGCGFGWHCCYAIEHGALSVTGIDLSERMLDKARLINNPPGVTYIRQPIEEVSYPEQSFDIVLSSLTFHYLASFDDIAKRVHSWLRPRGAFVFSVEHPVFTASGKQDWVSDDAGTILHWPVDRYFHEGPRATTFLGETVTKYHRTLTTYLNALLQQGFSISNVIEPTPDPATLLKVKGMEDELRRPMMLLIAAVK